MAEVCRDFGISRKTGYKIFDRYEEHGMAALTDRSRRPVRYANQLPQQIESLINLAQAQQATLGRAEDTRAADPALSGCPHPGDPMPAFLSGPGPHPTPTPAC